MARKKTTITLALNDNFLNAIKKDAENEGISINAKLNSVLQRYAFCYRYFEKDRVVIIPSKTAQLIFDNVEEQKLLHYCKLIVHSPASSKSISHNIPVTLQNWLEHFCNGLMLYTGMIEAFARYLDDDGYLCLSYTHDYGLKWSRILGSVLSEFIEGKLSYHTSCSILPNKLVIKILERNIEDI